MLNQKMIETEQQLNLTKDFFQRWIRWHNQVKQERILAIKVFQYQNSIQQKRLRQTFQLLKINNQQAKHYDSYDQKDKQEVSDNQDDQMYSLGLAIQYNQKRTYAKAIKAWIFYMNSCRKFDASLSAFYIKFLLKRYFQIVHEYTIQSKVKKAKKSQLSRVKFQTAKADTFNIQSHLKFLHMTSDIKQVEIPLCQQKQPYKPQKQTYKAQNIESKTFYNFSRQKLGESQRSQFSSMTGLDFESKRKFKAITELPSMPNLQSITKINKIENKTIRRVEKQHNLQQSHEKQQKQIIERQADSLIEQQKCQQKLNEVQINSSILNLITKQKLITYMFLNGQEFKQGQQFNNYRQKTLNSLQKIKLMKISS